MAASVLGCDVTGELARICGGAAKDGAKISRHGIKRRPPPPAPMQEWPLGGLIGTVRAKAWAAGLVTAVGALPVLMGRRIRRV